MQITLEKGTQSNYHINVSFDEKDLEKAKQSFLEEAQKDFDMQGFRKGHVPLNMIEQNMKPEYIKIGSYEKMINISLDDMLKQNPNIPFIGQPYDIQDTSKEKEMGVSYKIDVYPEIEVVNENWKALTIPKLDVKVTHEELENTMNSLKKQYAEYHDAETIGGECVCKIKLNFEDKDGQIIHTGSAFIDDQDYKEFPLLKDHFKGQKKTEQSFIMYEEKKLPHTFHLHKEGLKAAKIQCEVVDIKHVHLPKFDEETLKKLFPESTLKNEEDLIVYITNIIKTEKDKAELVKAVEHYLGEVKGSITVSVPKTIIDEEQKHRLKHLAERRGGEENFKKYFEQAGEEKSQQMFHEIKEAAKESLEKFFLLRKVTELLDLKDINRDNAMDAEQKLYDKLS